MKYFEEFIQRTTVTISSASKWALVFVVTLCLSSLSLAQDEETDENNEDEEDVEILVVTGSRVAQNPGEVAGQILIIDEEAIRATGEQTLERVLRQLPQNLNPTTERYGSTLNNVANFTSSSTVNLRGLGSESTLILVDGKRVGHNGILGGVTDVSSIPLNQIERIEIVLDGASAIYGSDAVGGVVNIVTKKDYEGVEVTADYNSPFTAGYNETRFGVNVSEQFASVNLRASYHNSAHTGLDAADREEVTLFEQSLFPGPRLDVRFCCLSDGTSLPIAYYADLGNWRGPEYITVPTYNELSDDYKATAIPLTHAILPEDFDENSHVNDISTWRATNWGADTQEGYTILPDVNRESVSVGVYWELDEFWSVEAQLRQESRDVVNSRGYVAFTGETLAANNPYNPFDRTIHLRGQRRDYPQPYNETEAVQLDFNIEVKGRISDTVNLEVSVGQSTDDADTLRYYDVDRAGLRAGMNSDGETPSTQFLFGESQASCLAKGGTFGFGLCRVPVPAPPAVNPFGDISQFIADTPLVATGLNRLFLMEALLRTELFEVPAGSVRAIVGVSRQTVVLESSSEFQIGAVDASPISDITQFDTEAERTHSSIFAEGMVPLVSGVQEHTWARRLTLSLSLRNDTYDEPEVTYVNPNDGNSSPTGLPDPGSQSTWGLGLVWAPVEPVEVKYNFQTAYVAPQLNQLLRASSMGPSPPYRGIFLQLPNGSLRQTEITIVEGGNPDLLSETADTQSIGVTFQPPAFPNLSLNATINDVQYYNRINRLSTFIVDPQNLPSDITYIAEIDQYVQERRWINVSSVERNGIDFSLRWTPSTDLGDFDFRMLHSIINSYEYIIDPDDPENDETISVVGETDGSTAVGVVSKNSTNWTFGWHWRGLQLNIDQSTRSKTTTAFTGVTREYTPPTVTDVSLTYHITDDGVIPLPLPQMFVGGRITAVFNNLLDKYGETSITSSDGEILQPNGPDASPLYGRVFNISVYIPL